MTDTLYFMPACAAASQRVKVEAVAPETELGSKRVPFVALLALERLRSAVLMEQVCEEQHIAALLHDFLILCLL